MAKQKSSTPGAYTFYLNKIEKIPLLSSEKERALAIAIHAGNQQARNQLIQAYLRLVVKIARKYINPLLPLIDLIQEGNLGLLQAAAKFDYRKNVKFSVYATYWIKATITKSIYGKSRMIKLPARKELDLVKIKQTRCDLACGNAKKPTTKEIAIRTGLKKEYVAMLITLPAKIISLEQEHREDKMPIGSRYQDFTYQPEQLFFRKVIREKTRQSLQFLKHNEKEVIIQRFFHTTVKKTTLKSLSHKMGISLEMVRQLQLRGLKKLAPLADELKAYYYRFPN